MTPELADAMRRGEKPFVGKVVLTEECTPAQMIGLSRAALEYVSGLDESDWLYFRDWHLHDGWLIEPVPVARDKVRDWHREVGAMPWDEDMVFPSVYPTTKDWLWRWYIDEFDREYCRFDFTAPDELIDGFLAGLPSELREVVRSARWDELFDVRHLGC